MTFIYPNSFVPLVVIESGNTNERSYMLPDRNSFTKPLKISHKSEALRTVHNRRSLEQRVSCQVNLPRLTRALAFQKRLLSPQTI